MAAVPSQLFGTNGAVLEVDLSSKSLHRGEKCSVQPVIGFHSPKEAGDLGAHRRENEIVRMTIGPPNRIGS